MNIYLHSNSTLPVLLHGEKKVKDLNVGDRVLCLVESQDTLITVTTIDTEDYNNWSKITYSNDTEVIFDRNIPFQLGEQLYNLLGLDNLSVSNIKEYNKTSKAYKITFEEPYESLYINDIVIRGSYE